MSDDQRGRDHLRSRVDELATLVRVEAEKLIQTDGLTGLRNQRGLHDYLDQLLAGDDAFWCAFVELDKFKSINSRFGQANGDGLLQRVAGALGGLAQEFGATAFRAHGDEFYLVGVGDDGSGAAQAAVSAVGDLEVAARGKDEVMGCTASVGFMTVTSDDAVGRSEVLLRTEHAVHHAKSNGRNQAVLWARGMGQSIATVEVRPECRSCGVKFSADLERSERTNLHCPACGSDVQLAAEDRAALAPLGDLREE